MLPFKVLLNLETFRLENRVPCRVTSLNDVFVNVNYFLSNFDLELFDHNLVIIVSGLVVAS